MAVDVERTAPPSGADRNAAEAAGPERLTARRGWLPKRIVGALAALAAVGAVLVFTSGWRDLTTDLPATEDPVTEAPPGVASLTGELEDGYVAFTDPETGISLQHPESWVPLKRPDGTQRLLLSPGGNTTFSVRVEPLDGVSVVDTPEELVQVQAVTDRIAGGAGLQVVSREAIELNGMLGIAYLARFTEEASGTKVVNAHYFLFSGDTMYILLFQAAPEEDFEVHAADFDKVLASFQGVPVEATPAEETPAGE